MKNQYHFWKAFPTYESLVSKRFSSYSMGNLAHSLGRRPKKYNLLSKFFQNHVGIDKAMHKIPTEEVSL
jgi:hypothetical protein